jgi:signal transduction histidine kinase
LSVYDFFERDKVTPGLIILKEGKFYGLLSRTKFFELMSKQFMYDVFSKRRIDYFFEKETSEKHLVLSSSTSIISATSQALHRDGSNIFEPIVVICANNEVRILDFYQLLVAQNKIQLLMNELLNQANEFKKEVLAIVTHDLRNPIGAILGFSDLMMDVKELDTCKEYALVINKAASQMEDLVKSFLASALNDSNEFDLAYSIFDFTELVHSVIKNLEHSASKKQQIILVDIPEYPINISSDPLKIREVIENLVSNAIKYSKHGMEINVSATKNDQYIELMIQDHGPGFSESDLKKVFNKFQRLSARPTDNESSTGLGLFITKKVVDKLNGSIVLESEFGKGSTFTVNLPVK